MRQIYIVIDRIINFLLLQRQETITSIKEEQGNDDSEEEEDLFFMSQEIGAISLQGAKTETQESIVLSDEDPFHESSTSDNVSLSYSELELVKQ
jgi:hypothetical protein